MTQLTKVAAEDILAIRRGQTAYSDPGRTGGGADGGVLD